jgi:hypothetical protein
MRSPATNTLALLATLVLAAACVGVAGADRVQANAADQAAANRDVLHLADLPATVTWKATKLDSPNSAEPASCKKLDYSSASVVDTGGANRQFTTPGMLVMNQVGLVAEPSMVDLVWKHTFATSISSCIDDAFSQGGAGRIKVISSKPIAFPRLTPHQSAYRIVFQIEVKGKVVRGAFDVIALGSRRTISMLMVMGILGAPAQQAIGERAMTLIDLDLAGKISARAFTSGSSSGLTA